MRIVFVRHGHPDYKLDNLTELGHLHAKAAAQRLREENFTRIFSSTHGRAIETAEHIAEGRDLPIESFDFMREVKWGSINGEPLESNGGYPWSVVTDMVSRGDDLMLPDWMEKGPFANNSVKILVENIGKGFDELLATLGYVREGLYYRVIRKNDDTVAMVSHGGSSSAAMSHLLNLPFPFFCDAIRMDFTGITILRLTGEAGDLIAPRIEILNDCRHIQSVSGEVIYGI